MYCWAWLEIEIGANCPQIWTQNNTFIFSRFGIKNLFTGIHKLHAIFLHADNGFFVLTATL